MIRRILTYFSLALLLNSGAASALDSDRFQPIQIQADSALVNENSGASVYKGNVIIVQGTLQVTADEVEIFTNNSEVTQIIATGNRQTGELAHYQQQTNEAKDMVVANAKKITYLVQEERLHLAGNAHLKQVKDEFTGELLYYDIPQGIVSLQSGPSSERVRMTLTPKKSEPNQSDQGESSQE